MADEQLPAETTAPETVPDQVEIQTPEEQPLETSTPVVQEEPQKEPDQGDLRIPLQEERRKRQDLEQQMSRLNDPAFIFEQAKRLGLAEGEYSSAEAPTAQQASDVKAQVRYELDLERAIKEYPDVANDPVLAQAAAALIQQGHAPTQAADIVQKALDKRIAKATESQVTDRINAAAAAEAAKRGAELTESGATGSSDSAENERLTAASKNWKNPRDQEAALLELMKQRMKG